MYAGKNIWIVRNAAMNRLIVKLAWFNSFSILLVLPVTCFSDPFLSSFCPVTGCLIVIEKGFSL